jgi:hypothetical protein
VNSSCFPDDAALQAFFDRLDQRAAQGAQRCVETMHGAEG